MIDHVTCNDQIIGFYSRAKKQYEKIKSIAILTTNIKQ